MGRRIASRVVCMMVLTVGAIAFLPAEIGSAHTCYENTWPPYSAQCGPCEGSGELEYGTHWWNFWDPDVYLPRCTHNPSQNQNLGAQAGPGLDGGQGGIGGVALFCLMAVVFVMVGRNRFQAPIGV